MKVFPFPILLGLLGLFVAPATAQNTAEPQYQLTGKDYRTEAGAIQQMFYNVAGAVKGQNSKIAVLPGSPGFNGLLSVSTITWANGQISTGPVTAGAKGDTGATGATGSTGATGATGPQGPTGSTGTISVGVTSSVSSTTAASVTDTGTSTAAVLNFYIPIGHDGAQGPVGPTIALGSVTIRGATDNLLGSVNGSQTAFTLSQSYSSTSSVHVVLDGLTLYNPTDYSLSGQTLNMVTAPASNSSSFYAFYDVYTSTFPGLITSGSACGGGLSGTFPNCNVATNANLTGPVTSVGNATTIAGPVPVSTIDLSTVTTKFSTKASTGVNSDITTLTAVSSFTVNGFNTLGAWYTWTASATATGAMTVTAGTINSASFMVLGKTMFFDFEVYGITVGGTPTGSFYINLPPGITAGMSVSGGCSQIQNAGTYGIGIYTAGAGDSKLAIDRDGGGTAWLSGTARAYCAGAIPIQ